MGGRTALRRCAAHIRDKEDSPNYTNTQTVRKHARDKFVAVARVLIESGADPDHLDDDGCSARTLTPDTMHALLDERERDVTTAAVAASIMSGLCGENTGSLLASFLATPWMLSRIQP